MDPAFIAIDYHQPLWLGIALVFGLAVRAIGLPPLVGFLAAGFMLNALGAEAGVFLQKIADLGVTLLLFTIGLKLRVSSLFKPEVWAVTLSHMLLTVILLSGFILLLAASGMALFAEFDLMTAAVLAFALSFSSTVFAVKTLETAGATASRYGKIAIGVLVMQDIVAVVFIAISAGKLPSIWAVSLLLLIPLRKPLLYLLKKAGHGELLILMGFVLALGGAALFEAVHLKGDLGALIFGVLLAGHSRASELYEALLGFKELFLVGFFLSIGLTGLPTLDVLLVAGILLSVIPLKSVLFIRLFTGFRLTSRTSWFASLMLSNFSEFGLIVVALAVNSGWLSGDWLVVMALLVSVSFVLAAPLNTSVTKLYIRFGNITRNWQHGRRLVEDLPIDIGDANTMVFGVGRVGTAVFDRLHERLNHKVIGIDFNKDVVATHRLRNRNVVTGDVTNPDFWTGLSLKEKSLSRVILTMPSHAQQLVAVKQLYDHGYQGQIAATAKYPDHAVELQKLGVDAAFDLYSEAGTGFAEHVWDTFTANSKTKLKT